MDPILLVVVSILVFLVGRYYLRSLTIGSYHDRYVFITGCDTGFGNLLAKKLDSMGMHVFAGCLTSKGQEELGKATSERLVTIPLDVTNGKSIEEAFNEVKKRLPNGKGLWGLVNNAGVTGSCSPVEWLNMDEYRKCNDVNLFGLIHVTTVFLPLVRKAKGRIVSITSIMGRIALVASPYVVSKYGAEGFCDTLRYQMYKSGVSVHIIEPGFFLTPLLNLDKIKADLRNKFFALDDERKEYYGEEFLQKGQDGIDDLHKIISPHVYKVVNSYSHALTAVYPKARYVVGWDANIPFRVLWNLPEWLSTWIISRSQPNPKGSVHH